MVACHGSRVSSRVSRVLKVARGSVHKANISSLGLEFYSKALARVVIK